MSYVLRHSVTKIPKNPENHRNHSRCYKNWLLPQFVIPRVISCSRQSKIHLLIYLFSVYSLCCPYICQSWTWYSDRQNFLVHSTSPNQSQVQTAKTGPSFIGPFWKTRLYASSECKTVLTNLLSKWHIHISCCWTHYTLWL